MFARTPVRVARVPLLAALGLAAAGVQDAVPPALREMADTEREFARTARAKGIRDSFLEFFADDSIALTPAPVSAKERLRRRPAQPFSANELTWEPRTGDVAASGELGWLTGPSTFIDHTGSDHTPRCGNYLSVWRKQPDGRWRVFIDVGASTPEPVTFAPGFNRIAFAPRYRGTDTKDAATASLRKADADLNGQLSDGPGAYADRLTASSRLHRNRIVSLVGADAIVAWLERNAAGMSAETAAAEASNAGDVGYSYGTYRLKSAESGAYIRMWARDVTGRWFVLADVAQEAGR